MTGAPATPAADLASHAAHPRVAVVAPTFNHAPALAPALLAFEALEAQGLPIVLVNDGSTDATADLLRAWQHARPATRTVLTHPRNAGKARALRTGFEHARAQGFTHALTIDTDGQHDAADAPALLRACLAQPHALVLGERPASIPGYPRASRLGRALSNALLRLEGGQRVADSQCGLRVYPLAGAGASILRARAERYGFETEALVRAGWMGVPIARVPVTCTYQVRIGPHADVRPRTTHFRLFTDTLASAAMHARLLERSARPWKLEGAWARAHPLPGAPGAPDLLVGTLFARLIWWFSPRRAWEQARGSPLERQRFAASVAVGFFMAAAPIYGIKTVACLALAKVLRLNPLVVLATSSTCTPPVGLLYILASLALGFLVLGGTMPPLSELRQHAATTLGSVLAQWIVGSLVLGLLLAGASYALTRLMLLQQRAPQRAS
jgi:uncharacterized protein (DUF2062 family)